MPKKVLITGASGGIGQALCRVFTEAGYWAIGLDRVSSDMPVKAFIEADLRKICLDTEYRIEVIDSIREHMGKDQGLDALVNNAAVQILKSTEEITVEDWHQTLDINLVAPFVLAQGLLNELEKAVGSVVNIASIHANLTKPGFVCYATSKAALVGLTKSMAVDLGAKVRVNAICPAAVATPMLMAGFAGKEAEFQDLSKMHPIGRIAQPEEVAKAALFLVSPEASFISGSVLNIDGAMGDRLHDPI